MPFLCTKFSTVWECSDAVAAGQVDWRLELGPKCPICGGQDCWREITPYERKVIELMPYGEGTVWVARFLCRTTGRTFSLLPHWLVPYHQYTAASILFALLLAAAGKHGSLFAVAEKELDPDGRANGFLLSRWLDLCVTGLRRAHGELSRWAALGGVRQGRGVRGMLGELASYCQALGIRAPPSGEEEAWDPTEALLLLERHARATGRFLFGVPSQERGRRAAP